MTLDDFEGLSIAIEFNGDTFIVQSDPPDNVLLLQALKLVVAAVNQTVDRPEQLH